MDIEWEIPNANNDSIFAVTPCQQSVHNSPCILKILRDLYEENRLCDVYLIVGNKQYGAHKLILSASSDVFQVMLMRTEWNESNQNQIKLGETPQCEEVFHLFLKYFYTGELIITHTNVLPLLSLADKYMVKSLSHACLQYMSHHVPHASSYNQLFLWLQYFQSCGYKDMASACEVHIRLNFDSIICSGDFVNLDPENMVKILKQDDLVVQNEAMLYNGVVRWLNLQQSKLEDENAMIENEDAEMKDHKDILEYIRYLLMLVMQHVRFPMMKPREIADLLRSPLVKENIEFFMEKMSKSVDIHSGSIMEDTWLKKNKHLMKPRIYFAENYSTTIYIENLEALPRFHKIPCDFETDSSVFETRDCSKRNRWSAFFYPKGVLFDPCYLIHLQGRYEIPENVVNTVRLNITCKELIKPGRFKFSVLAFGLGGELEHVIIVKNVEKHIPNVNYFFHIDNIMPFHILNPPEEHTLNYDNSSSICNKAIKIMIIIIPLS